VISTATLPLIHEGKVRRLYALSDPNQVLIVATDAISAFDQVLSTPIPDKGAVLTQLSLWWSEQLGDICPNHVISTEVPPDVVGRAVVCERLEMIPVECVARGYITGSGWAEYQTTGRVTDIELPPGLRHADRLPEPIFTPAHKAPLGQHDENISFDRLVESVGLQVAQRLRDLTLALFARGSRIAAERGIILADTKFEFGRRPNGDIVLADEVLTPDSSRFWDAAQYQPGAQIPSFDKQYVRDWLAYDSGWDRSSDQPAPPLPRMVVQATRDRYLEAYTRLTGRGFSPSKSTALVAQPVPLAPARPQSRFVVDVMPKPEILDPQGKAITGALARMGHQGFSVRQGKRFEIESLAEASDELLAQVNSFAEALLANTVIENFTVTAVEPAPAPIPAGPAPTRLALPPAPAPVPAAPPTFAAAAWSVSAAVAPAAGPSFVPAPAVPTPEDGPAAVVTPPAPLPPPTAPSAPVAPAPAAPAPAVSVPVPVAPAVSVPTAAAPAVSPGLDGGALSALSDDLAEALRALKATAEAMASLAGGQELAPPPAPTLAPPAPAPVPVAPAPVPPAPIMAYPPAPAAAVPPTAAAPVAPAPADSVAPAPPPPVAPDALADPTPPTPPAAPDSVWFGQGA
jgi:phosphoribosylaminoimidazole-succinocarboxamide synthase